MLAVGAFASAAGADEGLEFVNKEGAGHKLIKNKFTSTSGEIVIETASGTTTKCKSSTDHGVLTSTTGGELTILFKEGSSAGLSCKGGEDAAGKAKAGEIIILYGLLTTPSNKGTERLLLLTIFKTGTLQAGEFTFECSGVPITLKGSILTSNNYKLKVLSKTFVLEYKSRGAKTGEQSVTESENSKGEKIKCKGFEASINGGSFEKMSVTYTDTMVFEEEGQFV